MKATAQRNGWWYGHRPDDNGRPDAARLKLAMLASGPFSGATLFSFLLDRHPLIVCGGETFPTNATENRGRCSCGVEQIDCEFYRRAASHMLAPDGRSFDDDLFRFAPHYLGNDYCNRALDSFWLNASINRLQQAACKTIPALSSKEHKFARAHEKLYRNTLQATGAEVVVDGTKEFRRGELFARSGRFGLKVIHFIRDGRAFCFSFRKNRRKKVTLAEGARFWVKHIRKVDVFAKRFRPIAVLHVRYEDLCRDLVPTLKSICEFLDLSYDERMQSGSDAEQHLLGNKMRLTFDGKITERTSWKSELSKTELDEITEIMRPGLVRFQYL